MRDQTTLFKAVWRQLDEAEKMAPDHFLSWLRGAFFSHSSQIDYLLADLRELRSVFLAEVKRPLTLREAQLLRVCRVCRGEDKPSEGKGSFRLDFGEEYAHEKCLET